MVQLDLQEHVAQELIQRVEHIQDLVAEQAEQAVADLQDLMDILC